MNLDQGGNGPPLSLSKRKFKKKKNEFYILNRYIENKEKEKVLIQLNKKIKIKIKDNEQLM